MRIAIVADPFYPIPPMKYGGTERVIYYLIKGLKELGHEPVLLAPGDSQVDCELIPIVDKSIPFPRKPSKKFTSERDRIWRHEGQLLAEIAPQVDVIHSHFFDLADFQAYPCVTTIHGHIGFGNVDYYKERDNQWFVSISKNQQKTYPNLKYAGVAYNGLDPSEFKFVAKPKDYFCFLGRFDADKAPHLAIQLALAAGVPIKLAGKIDLGGYEYFKSEIKPYLKHPLVEFLGELGNKDKAELIGNASLNLHPLLGRREPFGLTVIESAYCGTPTMAMNRASMPELIKDARSGLLVEDFVEGLHRLDEVNNIDRHYVARRARQIFNYQAMARAYVKAYKKVRLYHRKEQIS